jgi:outer membrane protein assembly factor BamB
MSIASAAAVENWSGWRGPGGNGVSSQAPLPVRWSEDENIRWKAEIPGEGWSSPICWEDRIWTTSATLGGGTRMLHCLDRKSGKPLWRREIEDENPEVASSITGHAAATPATDGRRVVAWFGNAGAACWNFDGELLWHRRLGEFDTELGLASSPAIHGDLVYLLCDHDGDRFKSFDSFP